jgi:phosphoribosyl-ATP pyrophosphohydrolase/phosphoribosyl-AMP cyclohydrolase
MSTTVAAGLTWDERGLIPAVVQHAETGALLMVAWMNAESLALTRSTGLAHFWSRSRQKLWMKGETSGHTLAVQEVRTDCDADTLLIRALPAGPACHTGKPTCFFRILPAGVPATAPPDTSDVPDAAVSSAPPDTSFIEDDGPPAPAVLVLDRLQAILRARRDDASAEKSYTKSLLAGGYPKILAKIAEEHGELAAELPAGAAKDVVHETADLLFHVMVGLVARDIPFDDVWAELARRFGVSGHAEKAARPPKAEPAAKAPG